MRSLHDLSRDEKNLIALGGLSDVDGITPFVFTDGPNGVRGFEGSTVFPSALVLAASFDVALADEYGRMLAAEVRAAGANVLLGPVGDILRVPWNGRAGESFGEDPFLSGELAGHVGRAVQESGVLAIAKHFVANNFEHLRTGSGPFFGRTHGVDVVVSQRALREIYLEPFRRMIETYGLAGLMTSYNRLGGSYISQNAEMLDLPRREWGFTGATFPDFLFAVRDVEAALAAGLDIPGLDGASGREATSVAALSDDRIDALVGHVLSSIESVSLVEPESNPARLGTAAARELAQRIVREGAVLLKNDGVLPAAKGIRIALIAPTSLAHAAVVGGSAAVAWPEARVPSLGEELRRVGFDVVEVDPGAADTPLPTVTSELLADVAITVRDDASGVEATLAAPTLELYDRPEGVGERWSASVDASFLVPTAGTYRFALDFAGDATLTVNGTSITGSREASPMIEGPAYPLQAVVVSAGPIEISIRFATGAALDVPPLGFRPGFRLGWSEVSHAIDDACAAARAADLAVIVVGRASGEAMDVESLHLPAVQETLIAAVADAARSTLVVTMGSGPLVMPWHESVDSILHLGQAGERSAPALAELIAGAHEPGGRLPYTIPKSESDVPLHPAGYPGVAGTAIYSEGLAVGYRGYQQRSVDPLFAFGHGLGYTVFEQKDVRVAATPEAIELTAELRNVGPRAGKVVLQLYSVALDGDSPRALRGVGVATVPAGDVATMVITVPWHDLREFDEGRASYRHPANFRLALGYSSSDIWWSEEMRRTLPEA